MADLINERCEACREGAPQVTGEELQELLRKVPDWRVEERDDIQRLERQYKFTNFVEALAFTNRLGDLAEKEGHHPAILTEWGKVTVSWWTHKIKGLHRNDFIMAARSDSLFATSSALSEMS